MDSQQILVIFQIGDLQHQPNNQVLLGLKIILLLLNNNNFHSDNQIILPNPHLHNLYHLDSHNHNHLDNHNNLGNHNYLVNHNPLVNHNHILSNNHNHLHKPLGCQSNHSKYTNLDNHNMCNQLNLLMAKNRVLALIRIQLIYWIYEVKISIIPNSKIKN